MCNEYRWLFEVFTNTELQNWSRRDGAKGRSDDAFGRMKRDGCWMESDETISICINTWRDLAKHYQKTGRHHDRLRPEAISKFLTDLDRYENWVRTAAKIWRGQQAAALSVHPS